MFTVWVLIPLALGCVFWLWREVRRAPLLTGDPALPAPDNLIPLTPRLRVIDGGLTVMSDEAAQATWNWTLADESEPAPVTALVIGGWRAQHFAADHDLGGAA
jgi:hypothetical protein